MQTTERFTFDAKEHLYTLDGKPMIGVTSVLQVIAKPQLIQWAANEACKYISDNFPTFEQLHENPKAITELIEKARTAHRRKKEDAGSKGTDVHAEIEQLVKFWIATGEGKPFKAEHENQQVIEFVNWALENNVRFLDSEKRVYSEKYWYAGTADFTCEVNGKRYVGDLKTGSGIYPEAFYQTSAYRNALEEMGEQKFDGSIIVNTPQKGGINVEYSYFYQEDFETFLAALTIYRRQNKATN